MGNNEIVGAKIKNIRESKRLSIEEVAERSGLDVEQIERIGDDLGFPSLAPFIKIAWVSGVRLGTFLDDRAELGPVVYRKKDSEADGIGFTNNATQGHKHMDYHSLLQGRSGHHMEPFLVEIAPSEEDEDFILSMHEGEGFIYALSGVVEINYGKDTYILREGDSTYYDSIVAHHVHAAADNRARILGVVYIPY